MIFIQRYSFNRVFTIFSITFPRQIDGAIGILQESKLRTSSKTPIFPNYTTVRVDRPNGDVGRGGGAVPFTNTTAKTLANLPIDRTREILSLTLRVNGKDFHLANVYISPEGSCPRGYTPGDLSGLNANRTLVLEDFNARDQTWYYTQADDRIPSAQSIRRDGDTQRLLLAHPTTAKGR